MGYPWDIYGIYIGVPIALTQLRFICFAYCNMHAWQHFFYATNRSGLLAHKIELKRGYNGQKQERASGPTGRMCTLPL